MSCLALLGLLLAPALAQQALVFGFDGGAGPLPDEWAFKRWWPVVGVGDYEAQATVVDGASAGRTDGQRVLKVVSADSGLMVGTETRADVTATPVARWSWRADTLPAGGSFRTRDTNDQALQILFGFEGGRIVGYIWDTTNPEGASGSGLAWREDVRVIVVQSGTGALGRWVDERRDLAADFQLLFGEAPPALVGVAVQSNSQHTGSRAQGYVGPITLSPR